MALPIDMEKSGARLKRRVAAGERGQMLLLFVAIFSVIMMMGAFAIDQGLAYSKHGVAQSGADAASRAGAYGCLEDLSDGTTVSDCSGPKAASLAADNAAANLNASATPTGQSTCPGINGGGTVPTLTVEVDKTSPSLFSKLWGVGDFAAKATATTCVGGVSTLRSSSIATSPIPLIPVWFAGNSSNGGSDPNKSNCGPSGTTTFAGRICVVFTTEAHLSSAGTFYQASGQCGPTNSNNIDNAIISGLTTFTCSTTGPGLTDYYGNSSWQDDVLDAFENRLPGSGEPCAGGSSVPNGIGAVMATLDGDPAKPTGANPPGIDDPASTVYRQQTCQSKRLVLVPLVSGGGSTKTIQGFATVYITGCGRDDNGAPGSLNECDTDDRGAADGGTCQQRDRRGNCIDNSKTRVWGIVLRTYFGGETVQQIQAIGNNGVGKAAALSIQTMQ